MVGLVSQDAFSEYPMARVKARPVGVMRPSAARMLNRLLQKRVNEIVRLGTEASEQAR